MDGGEPCGPLEVGEMHLKTPSMAMSYLNQPKSALFDEEGYVKSGDMGYYDTTGAVFFVERCKEVIK